jgi:hypothetical protein
MSLMLSQLITPQGVAYWKNQLLQSLQGIGYVTQVGGNGSPQILGTGTVTPSGPATQAASVVVLISSTGNVGSGAFQYSTDGGTTFSGAITIPSGATSASGSFVITAIGVTLTFTNGAYLTPNQTGYFVAGETYSFTTSVPTFPVTNWEPGAASWSLIQADAQALADFSLTQAQVAAGGLTQSWLSPPPSGAPPDGWLDLLSQNVYNRSRIAGTYTTGIVQLSNSGSASQTITAGGLLLATATGQQFTNLTGGTLPAQSGATPGTLNITVQAVGTGASYNNVPTYVSGSAIPGGNYLNQLVSPTLPGVTVTNPINSTPPCIHVGTGPSSITLTGTASSAFGVIFLISAGGAVGTSTYSYSYDGGNTYTFGGVTVSTGTAAYFNGLTVGFPAGTYVAGDTYSFSTAWITTYGADTQTSVSLATADQNQWTQLAPSSPAGTYSNWALAASAEVTETFVTQSVTVPGQVNLLLVGQNNGPVSLTAIAAVQNYVIPRLGINDSVMVATVTQKTVDVTASSMGIQIQATQAASVYAGVAAALSTLQNNTPPGGTPGLGLVLSTVATAIASLPGVIQIVADSLLLNGNAADVGLAFNQVPLIVPPPQSSYNPI